MAKADSDTTNSPRRYEGDGFYVYTHARPDGSVFYVGKGRGRRAWDFSPSRRSRHHRNIVEKHGIDRIVVTVYPAENEAASFAAEREMIASLRQRGVSIINLTEGGEGASGRPMTDRQREGFKNGRGPWVTRLSEAAKQRVLEGMARGRAKTAEWSRTPEGMEHIRRIVAKSMASPRRKPHIPRTCEQCGGEFLAVRPDTRFCSRACQQRNSRALAKRSDEEKRATVYANNKSGVRGVRWSTQVNKWQAYICVKTKLRHLGFFVDKQDAISARKRAEEEVFGSSVLG